MRSACRAADAHEPLLPIIFKVALSRAVVAAGARQPLLMCAERTPTARMPSVWFGADLRRKAAGGLLRNGYTAFTPLQRRYARIHTEFLRGPALGSGCMARTPRRTT